MNHKTRLGLIVVVLVAVAVFATLWAIIIFEAPVHFQQRTTVPGYFNPGDLELYYVGSTVISTINIALLGILLVIYANIYIKTRSTFTIGLIVFALAFLMKDLTSSPFIVGLFSFRAVGLGPFEFLPGLFELAALSVLLYLSVKY
jgi:hypothetical protein